MAREEKHESHAAPQRMPSPPVPPGMIGDEVRSGGRPETRPAARPDRRVLTMLVCPSTRTELVYDAARHELISRAARVAYPIRDGVPVMTPDEARPLDDEELRQLAKRCRPRGAA